MVAAMACNSNSASLLGLAYFLYGIQKRTKITMKAGKFSTNCAPLIMESTVWTRRSGLSWFIFDTATFRPNRTRSLAEIHRHTDRTWSQLCAARLLGAKDILAGDSPSGHPHRNGCIGHTVTLSSGPRVLNVLIIVCCRSAANYSQQSKDEYVDLLSEIIDSARQRI